MSSNSSSSTTTSTFTLSNTSPGISISHPSSLSQDQLMNFPAFKTWLNTLQKSLALQHTSTAHPFHSAPYALRSIEVQSADFFSPHRLGFLKLKATVTNDNGESLPGSVFMRGGSVAMLIILTLEQSPSSSPCEEYVILTLQPRIAAGSLGFVELPAGMIDDSGSFAGAAAKEIREETGLEISSDELLDLTRLAVQSRSAASETPGEPQGDDDDDEKHLQSAIYPSPGGCDEFIPIMLARKTLKHAEIEDMRGKLTGLRDHGEKITLKIVPLDELWKVAGRDGKTLAALALYQGLKAEGRI